MLFPFSLSRVAVACLFAAGVASAQVSINEMQSTASSRVLRFDAAGYPALGCDVPWYALGYVKPAFWGQAAGPFGFGAGFTTGKNLQSEVAGKAMSFYLRREFTLSAAQAGDATALSLAIDYDDGFVAYLNGVEVARRNLGAAGSFAFVDQQTFNNHPGGTVETIQLAPTANALLRTGNNVLAIQVHNNGLNEGWQDAPNMAPGGSNMRCSPTLRTVATVLVNPTDSFAYYAGIHEPSGGLLDAAFTVTPIMGPNWSQVEYVDTSWGTVAGAMGYEFDGTGDYLDQMGTNAQSLLGGMRNVALAVFGRCEFTLTQAEYDAITTLSLQTDWDDGYALFVNGAEVDRQNVGGVAGALVPYNTSASGHGATRDGNGRTRPIVYRSIPLVKTQLRVGKNVVAAQLHNNGAGSSDLLLDVQLSYTGSPNRTLITRNTPWKYLIPTTEIGAIVPATSPPFEFVDWVELKNTTASPVSLAGWQLSDSRAVPAKWVFPAAASIPANGYLVVACSGLNITNPSAGGYLHTNFSLASTGEYLGLRNAAGQLVHEVTGIPSQDYFHTWGIDPVANGFRFLNTATPGTANTDASGATQWASEVEFSHETGHHATFFNLALTTLTPGASIRYTTDGSEPAATTGTAYTGPIALANVGLDTTGPGTGLSLREQWTGSMWPSTSITGTPVSATMMQRIDHAGGQDSYTSRFRGYIHVPTTGNYTFYLASDDSGDFWLSTTALPANKVRRCWVDGWCNYRDFTAQRQNYGGTAGDTSAQHPNQTSGPITLQAGQRYYFEANQVEYGGGDHLSMAWTGPGFPSITVIEGRYTSPPDTLPANVTYPPKAAVVRARAFAPGLLPSEVRTRNYAVGYPAAMSQIPNVWLAGNAGQTFFKNNGVFSIVGGTRNGEDWSPTDTGLDYNFSIMHGEAFERPATFEVTKPGIAEPVVRTTVGLRSAGSPWSRPKYKNQNLEESNWGGGYDTHNKPQMNVHFRGDYGIGKLKQEGFIPGSQVDEWDNLRLRAGKNDAFNPLIVDEFARRSFRSMGQNPAPIGFFANVFINGSWKGLFNPTERPREPLFQEFFQTQGEFDTIYIGSYEDGDAVAFDQMWNYFGANDFATLANYQTGSTYWNVSNVADYIAVYCWLGTQDFPHNNFVFTRERALGAKWHFSMWDAEASFSLWGQAQNYDGFANTFGLNDLNNASVSTEGGQVRRVVRRFAQSPEFKLHVADRIHKHFNNNGSMSPTALQARYSSLRSQVEGVILAGYGQNFWADWWTAWAVGGTGRTAAFLSQATSYGFWPSTQPPSFSQFGGTMATGSQLTLGNPNAGGAGTIYYTTNGTDPRLPGGGISGAAYTTALPISQPQTVKARILNGTVWSALTEADFAPPPPSVVFSEIHYNPPGNTDATEFIELLNISSQPANLTGAHFTDGIEFTFGNVVMAPGARLVLISNVLNLPAFQAMYPGVAVHGYYTGGLSNSGETLTLRDTTEAIICTLTYSELWQSDTDGEGASLVLKRPETMTGTDLSNVALWRRSVDTTGKPGSADSLAFAAPSILTDADHDGLNALVEHALGTSDAMPSGSPEYTVVPDGSGQWLLSVVLDGRTDDVTIEAVQTPDMQTWTPMDAVTELWDQPAGKITRTWVSNLAPEANRLLFRLKVTRN